MKRPCPKDEDAEESDPDQSKENMHDEMLKNCSKCGKANKHREFHETKDYLLYTKIESH